MKKIMTFILTLALALAMAGCGKSEKVPQGGASVDENGNTIAGTAIDGAGEEADMDKVDGQELKGVSLENSGINTKGDIGNCDVSIDDAKLVNNDGTNILVVSFTFKNSTDSPVAFDNLLSVDVTQGEGSVMPTVVTGYDGINILSAVEQIEKGEKTTVQKTYTLSDLETPVNVVVYKYGEPGGDKVAKTFNLK